MDSKLNYNLHGAINARMAETSDFKTGYPILDFRDSIEYAKEPLNFWNPPIWVEAGANEKMTREVFKKTIHNLREYYYKMAIEDSIDYDLSCGQTNRS